MGISEIYKRIAYTSQHGVALKVPLYPIKSRRKKTELKWMITIRYVDSVENRGDAFLEVSGFSDNTVDAFEIGRNNINWNCLLLRKV